MTPNDWGVAVMVILSVTWFYVWFHLHPSIEENT